MWICVVEAVDEDLLVVAGDAAPGDLVAIDTVRIELVQPVERDSVYAFERKDRR